MAAAAGRLRAARDRLLAPEAGAADEHWQRVVMMRAVGARIASLGPASLSAAEISGDSHAGSGFRSFTSLNHPEFDVCAPLAPELRGAFDVVICEQVIEHVVDPWAAAATLRELCAPGGHVIVSTPFLVRIHELPLFGMRDYWRFTPRGIGLLLERAGLQVDEVGSWGNRRCVSANFDRWPAYRRWQSLRNEPDLPLQVWAFARRPA